MNENATLHRLYHQQCSTNNIRDDYCVLRGCFPFPRQVQWLHRIQSGGILNG